jgi:NAD(P)-dependent dehydrogenase (short-subunit alcohol dehydrogenase family)
MSKSTSTKLQGKIALITGGNSGIGLATAQLFVQQGAKVIVTARSSETFAKAKKEFGTVFDVVQCDVSDLAALDSLFAYIKQKYQHLDIVFANAGIAEFRPTSASDAEMYDRIMNTNVKGVYFTVAKSLPLLRDGSSVFLNGSALDAKGMAGASVYSATKAALRSFVRSWTAEISPSKARFNVLSPGFTTTPIYGKMGVTDDKVAETEAGYSVNIPAKRFATSDEIATVALFLASSDSSYICGADIIADGGFAQV